MFTLTSALERSLPWIPPPVTESAISLPSLRLVAPVSTIRAAGPVTERIDFCRGIDFTEMVGLCIALADNQAVTVNDVFAVIGASLINVAGNSRRGFFCSSVIGIPLKMPLSPAADGISLVTGKVYVLGNDHKVDIQISGNAMHGGNHLFSYSALRRSLR